MGFICYKRFSQWFIAVSLGFNLGLFWESLEFSELFGYMYLPLGLIVVLMVSITYITSPLGLSGASLGYMWVSLVKRRIDKYQQKTKTKIKTKNSNIHHSMLINNHNHINHQRKHSFSSYCYMFIIVKPPCYTDLCNSVVKFIVLLKNNI